MTVQHIVMLEFNEGVAEDAKMAALKDVEALKGKIDGIESVQSGKDFSGRAGNFTHSVIVTAHKEVQAVLGPIVKTLWVIDIEPS